MDLASEPRCRRVCHWCPLCAPTVLYQPRTRLQNSLRARRPLCSPLPWAGLAGRAAASRINRRPTGVLGQVVAPPPLLRPAPRQLSPPRLDPPPPTPPPTPGLTDVPILSDPHQYLSNASSALPSDRSRAEIRSISGQPCRGPVIRWLHVPNSIRAQIQAFPIRHERRAGVP